MRQTARHTGKQRPKTETQEQAQEEREREREKEETPQNKATHKPRGRAAAINLWDVGCSRRWRVGATAAKRCGRLLREETAECIAGRAGLAARQRLAWAASTHPRLSRRAGASSNRRRCPAGVIPLDLAEMIGMLLLGSGGGGDGGALVPGHRTLRRHVAAGLLADAPERGRRGRAGGDGAELLGAVPDGQWRRQRRRRRKGAADVDEEGGGLE